MVKSSETEPSRIKEANRLLEQNRLDEARCIYEGLCVPGQQDIDLWLNLALVYRKSGSLEQARTACKRALSLRDDYALAHHIYGSVQQCLGHMGDAIDSYRRALELSSVLAETHYFLGNALQMTGRQEEAAVSYRSAIELKPDYLEALSNLGAVLMNLHQFDDALISLKRASQLCPECEQILCNLADLALTRDDFDQAESLARSVLDLNPEFFDAHFLLGKIYRKREDYGRALEHYSNARSLRPSNEDILGSIAEVLEMRGEFAAASKILDSLIEKNSTNPLVLRVFSSLSRHYGDEEKSINLIEKALGKGGLSLFQRVKLHSELGKQYDRLEKFPQAFSHYRQANEFEIQLNVHIRKKNRLGFPTRSLIDEWFLQFDADYWRPLARSEVTSDRPVFVVGMPRSGTTLVEQILASHPDVYGAGELPNVPDIVQQFKANVSSKGYMEFMEKLNVQQLTTAAEKYISVSGDRAGDALRVVDKMPMNFWHLGVISLLFPSARIIHMQRDPRDVCLSIYFQRFDASMTFTTDLQELAEYSLAYSRIMEYWHTVLDIKIMDVRYENLVADQENVIRRMIDFCGLDWDVRCLDFHKSARDVHTPSYDQVRQPMYSRSVGRWKNYQKQLVPLIAALGLDD